jgi:hypothetical protein
MFDFDYVSKDEYMPEKGKRQRMDVLKRVTFT